MKTHNSKTWVFAASVVLTTSLAACGGGGDGSSSSNNGGGGSGASPATVSLRGSAIGTTGPLASAGVVVKCSSGTTATTTTTTLGAWAATVPETALPCAAEITGTSGEKLHAFVQTAINNNANAVVEAILADAIRSDLSAWFASVNASALSALQSKIKASNSSTMQSINSMGIGSTGDGAGGYIDGTLQIIQAGTQYAQILDNIKTGFAATGSTLADLTTGINSNGAASLSVWQKVLPSYQTAITTFPLPATPVTAGVMTLHVDAGSFIPVRYLDGQLGRRTVMRLDGFSGIRLSALQRIEMDVRQGNQPDSMINGPRIELVVDTNCSSTTGAGETVGQLRNHRKVIRFDPTYTTYSVTPPDHAAFTTVVATPATKGWYIVRDGGVNDAGMQTTGNFNGNGTLSTFDFASYPNACLVDAPAASPESDRDLTLCGSGTYPVIGDAAPGYCAASMNAVSVVVGSSTNLALRDWQIRRVKINGRTVLFK